MFHLLVVDDDLATRETYRAALRHEGYAVDLAASGRAAIIHLSTSLRPDAIILDYHLGDMTGCDVLRWMRREQKLSPTAVLTAFPGTFDPDEVIALDALAYSEQPLDIEALATLARSLTTSRLSDNPAALHMRLIGGDAGALETLATVFLQEIPRRLQHAFPKTPWDMTVDACVDAALEYGAGPTRFDAARGIPLVEFVYVIARRNLQDTLAAEASRRARERRWFDERMRLDLGQRENREHPEVWDALRTVLHERAEQRALACWMQGGDTLQIATSLGHGSLPIHEQREKVYAFKARLLKRLSRRISKH